MQDVHEGAHCKRDDAGWFLDELVDPEEEVLVEEDQHSFLAAVDALPAHHTPLKHRVDDQQDEVDGYWDEKVHERNHIFFCYSQSQEDFRMNRHLINNG